MKIYYVVNARMPSEKAHGIQVAKMCEALIEEGADVTLVLPSRGRSNVTIAEYYQLRITIPLVVLPVPDFYLYGRIGFFVSSFFFMIAYSLFLLFQKLKGIRFILYSVDMDTYSYAILPLIAPTSVEMHSPKKKTIPNSFFFARVQTVIATNTLIASALQQTFHLPKEKLCIAPNGFDAVASTTISKGDAREKLGVPEHARIALYVGRLLSWKGMSILPQALHDLPDGYLCYVVGGTQSDLASLTKMPLPKELIAVGEKDSHEIPMWLASADIGIVLGTKENESSYRYTSPMKVFEYMGAGLPIVASRTPALEDVLAEDEVFFYTPDSIESLRDVIIHALSSPDEGRKKAENALQRVQSQSWSNRANKVLSAIIAQPKRY